MSIYICEKIAKSYLALPFLFNIVTSLLKKSYFPAVFSILQPKLPESHSDFLVCYRESHDTSFGHNFFWKKSGALVFIKLLKFQTQIWASQK